MKSRLSRLSQLIGDVLLHYQLDLTLFDGYHTPSITPEQTTVLHFMSDMLILMECYDLERTYVEGPRSCIESSLEGAVGSCFHVTFARQALHFNPSNSNIRLFLGRAFRFLRNPLASAFNLLASQNTGAPATALSTEELCTALLYYRSQYIRLRTESDERTESCGSQHCLLQTRLAFYSFLYLVEICVMKIGVREVDYVLMHFEDHFQKALAEESCKLVSENALMYFVLISVLCAHNSFFPFAASFATAEEADQGAVLINLSNDCVAE